ncbi:MFS transporter, partial [Burkholderia sp. KCJ3K979]|uniref:MFS transporter n=1 Tax=Burkholderia sp. KCJ3K979 TaxID=2759149 RepID=UPI001F0045CE
MRSSPRTQRESLIKIYAHKVHSSDLVDRAAGKPFEVISPLVPISRYCLHPLVIGVLCIPSPASFMTDSPTQSGRTTDFLPYLVAATFFMEYLDTTVIATALPQMANSFGVGPNALSLGMTAYMLALAVFIPISGWIADRYGSRTVFASAIVVFTGASV